MWEFVIALVISWETSTDERIRAIYHQELAKNALVVREKECLHSILEKLDKKYLDEGTKQQILLHVLEVRAKDGLREAL